MQYYSTKLQSSSANLRDAIIGCVPADGGLYMPASLPVIPRAFINNMADMTFREIAYVITDMLLGSDMDSATLKHIVDEALSFSVPLVRISPDRYIIELFHGPTLAFKDMGARFMAKLISTLDPNDGNKLNVLVATTGNTGAAIANGFLGIDNVNVFILYPRGAMPRSLETQITSIGQNIRAIEVSGSIDDCKKMVASALLDKSLNETLLMTSGNSTNIARLLPQIALFFHAAARLSAQGVNPENVEFAIPSGNLSLLTSGAIAKRMGLMCGRLIAACNANNAFDRLLQAGDTSIRPTVKTIARFMDLSMPTNIPRLMSLYGNDTERMKRDIASATVGDEIICSTILSTFDSTGYMADPHTAVGLAALDMRNGIRHPGLVFATAHPAKTLDAMTKITGRAIELPLQLTRFMGKQCHHSKLPPTYPAFRKFLLSNQ